MLGISKQMCRERPNPTHHFTLTRCTMYPSLIQLYVGHSQTNVQRETQPTTIFWWPKMALVGKITTCCIRYLDSDSWPEVAIAHDSRGADRLGLLDTTLNDTKVSCELGLMMIIALVATHVGTNVLVAFNIVGVVVVWLDYGVWLELILKVQIFLFWIWNCGVICFNEGVG